jgi:hypothetical protein
VICGIGRATASSVIRGSSRAAEVEQTAVVVRTHERTEDDDDGTTSMEWAREGAVCRLRPTGADARRPDRRRVVFQVADPYFIEGSAVRASRRRRRRVATRKRSSSTARPRRTSRPT